MASGIGAVRAVSGRLVVVERQAGAGMRSPARLAGEGCARWDAAENLSQGHARGVSTCACKLMGSGGARGSAHLSKSSSSGRRHLRGGDVQIGQRSPLCSSARLDHETMTEGWKEGLEVEGVDRQLLPPAGSRSGRVMQHRCRAGGGSYRRDKLLRSQTKLVAGPAPARPVRAWTCGSELLHTNA